MRPVSSIGPMKSPTLSERRQLAILNSQVPWSTSRSVTRGMILWGDMGSESASFALDCRGAEKRRKGEAEKPQASLTVEPSPFHIYVVIALVFGDKVREIGGDSRGGVCGNVFWRGTKHVSLRTGEFSISFCPLTLSYTEA